jgi:hypothetical protein
LTNLDRAGDVVICIRPVNARESVIKRVTAVEGQTVSLYSRGSTAPTRLQVGARHERDFFVWALVLLWA